MKDVVIGIGGAAGDGIDKSSETLAKTAGALRAIRLWLQQLSVGYPRRPHLAAAAPGRTKSLFTGRSSERPHRSQSRFHRAARAGSRIRRRDPVQCRQTEGQHPDPGQRPNRAVAGRQVDEAFCPGGAGHAKHGRCRRADFSVRAGFAGRLLRSSRHLQPQGQGRNRPERRHPESRLRIRQGTLRPARLSVEIHRQAPPLPDR